MGVQLSEVTGSDSIRNVSITRSLYQFLVPCQVRFGFMARNVTYCSQGCLYPLPPKKNALELIGVDPLWYELEIFVERLSE
jgi:hypothetical protein